MKIAAGDDLLAGARLSFDQNGERRVGILLQLAPELFDYRAVANQQRRRWLHLALFERTVAQCAFEGKAQVARVAGFCDEISGSERSGMAGIARVALP